MNQEVVVVGWVESSRPTGVRRWVSKTRPTLQDDKTPSPGIIKRSLVHIWIGTEILEHLLPVLLVHHEVDTRDVVAVLHLALRLREDVAVGFPVAIAALLAEASPPLLGAGAETFEQLVVQRQEELGAAG